MTVSDTEGLSSFWSRAPIAFPIPARSNRVANLMP